MSSRPSLLDLFCGAGGCSVGYQRAGFYVVGVDIDEQPSYCGDEFVHEGALAYLERLLWRRTKGEAIPFDAIHASPPCQAFTALKVMHNARDHVDILTPTRSLLEQIGLPYVIENVPGAPIDTAFRLCGTSFGLGVEAYDGWRELRRHRYFETSFPMLAPPCQHSGPTIGLYGDHARDRRRKANGERGRDFPDKDKLGLGREAMGMPWAKRWREVTEAVPPAYTEFIGRQLLEYLQPAKVAGAPR